MRNKMGSLLDWDTFKGSATIPFGNLGPQPLRFEGVTQGATVSVVHDGGTTVVFHGEGRFEVDCGVTGPSTIVLEGKGLTSLRIEGVKPRAVGWDPEEASFTDVEPKPFGSVAPEVEQMFRVMQRNMLAREAALREEFLKRNP